MSETGILFPGPMILTCMKTGTWWPCADIAEVNAMIVRTGVKDYEVNSDPMISPSEGSYIVSAA